MSTRPGRERLQERRARAARRAEVRRQRTAAMRRHPTGRASACSGRDVTPPVYRVVMDTTTSSQPLPPAPEADGVDTRAAGLGVGPVAGGSARPGTSSAPGQAPVAAQPALPFGSGSDDPIPFSLTARARRVVAPDALPPLTIVSDEESTQRTASSPSARTTSPTRSTSSRAPGEQIAPLGRVPARERDGSCETPSDTRASRARALRRAGLSVAHIARQLQVDELLVRAWVGEFATDVVATLVTAAGDAGIPPTVGPTDEAALVPARVRSEAAAEARRRVVTDAAFAAGLGLVTGLATTDVHAVTITAGRPQLAARALAWLRDEGHGRQDALRVVLRLGAGVAGDLARHRWAELLGVPVGHVVHTRWRGAPGPDAVEALVRIADPQLAATLAGWSDALLEPHGGEIADPSF